MSANTSANTVYVVLYGLLPKLPKACKDEPGS